MFIPDKCDSGSCWLFLGEVADTLKVKINDEVIGDFGDSIYLRPLSLILPIPSRFQRGENIKLTLEVSDMNQTIFGLREKEIFISSFFKVFRASFLDFLTRTGSMLLSAACLLILFFILLVVWLYSKNKKKDILLLLAYTLVSCLYILSFSEFLQILIQPLFAAGPLHFSFRLAQDLFLIVAIMSIVTNDKIQMKSYLLIASLYIISILGLYVAWVVGIHHYIFYRKYMQVCAILLLLPFIAGFILTFKSPKEERIKFQRSYFFLFMIFQINDLFVFWQIYRGVFLVKWYLPCIVILLATIVLQRARNNWQKLHDLSILAKAGQLIAHDLKMPLEIIKSFLSLVKNNYDSQKFQSLLPTFINSLEKSLTTANAIISDLILVGRSTILTKSMVHLKEIVDEVLIETRPLYETKKIQISSLNDLQEKTFCDRNKIHRVVSNLILNAIEASANQEHIQIKIKKNFKSEHQVDIFNSQSFISRKDQDRIFEFSFTKGKKRGSGLGLSICKQIVDAHGGSIFVSSQKGMGTTFSFTLPELSLISTSQLEVSKQP